MRKMVTAVLAAVLMMPIAVPASAQPADMFNPTTMLGWRQQTRSAIVGYFRMPLGPSSLGNLPMRAGVMITGPRTYSASEAILYSRSPRILDFSLTGRSLSRPVASLSIGNTVAWTSDPRRLPPGQVNLMDSGTSWLAVGALTVGLLVGLNAMIEDD